MIKSLRNIFLRWLHGQCAHDGHVAVDLLEGCFDSTGIQWCSDCGAFRTTRNGRPVMPWRLARDPWVGYQRDLRRWADAAGSKRS